MSDSWGWNFLVWLTFLSLSRLCKMTKKALGLDSDSRAWRVWKTRTFNLCACICSAGVLDIVEAFSFHCSLACLVSWTMILHRKIGYARLTTRAIWQSAAVCNLPHWLALFTYYTLLFVPTDLQMVTTSWHNLQENITHDLNIPHLEGGGGSTGCWKIKTDIRCKIPIPPPPCLTYMVRTHNRVFQS
jgi:hypothetical protein